MSPNWKRSKGERAARAVERQAREGVLVEQPRPYETRKAPARPITDDDYVGMAPCIYCPSFPGMEPWYATDEEPGRIIHRGMDGDLWHSMSRERFGLFQKAMR